MLVVSVANFFSSEYQKNHTVVASLAPPQVEPPTPKPRLASQTLEGDVVSLGGAAFGATFIVQTTNELVHIHPIQSGDTNGFSLDQWTSDVGTLRVGDHVEITCPVVSLQPQGGSPSDAQCTHVANILRPSTDSTSPVNPRESHPTAQVPDVGPLISKAEDLFSAAEYRQALDSCNVVLRLDPNNSKAAQLKARIQKAMSILGEE
jgi:hypothetical protein